MSSIISKSDELLCFHSTVELVPMDELLKKFESKTMLLFSKKVLGVEISVWLENNIDTKNCLGLEFCAESGMLQYFFSLTFYGKKKSTLWACQMIKNGKMDF